MRRVVAVAGIDLAIEESGSGPPLLFLHAGEGMQPERSWFELLARRYRVIAPYHPGFGPTPLPDWFGSVDDLAYLYLDLAAQLDLRDALLVGACFGGWVAAEMAVRSTARFSAVVLAAPLGVKFGGTLERDITDMHGITRAEFLALAWSDPAKGQIDYTLLSDTDLAGIARGREALALYGWKPYMHNPRLKHWLHRINNPTHLIWGQDDRIVTPGYGDLWRGAIPRASLEVIPGAGHYPHWEQPDAFASAVTRFHASL